MVEAVVYHLLGVALILLFGYFAEFMFKKVNVPDVLFLILLGFVLGPVLKYVTPEQIEGFAPFFTAFALLFVLFDGAFSIDFRSLAKGFSSSIVVTAFNFFVSTIVIAAVLMLINPLIEKFIGFSFTIPMAFLVGFALSGTSSSFVIPILKQLNVKGEIYSVLTIESALTDVFCIVFAFATMEIIKLASFNPQSVISNIASLFAVAGFIGIIAGIVWIVIVGKVLKHNKSYMATIAYLIMVYVVTEFLHGNGAIAALFFGLVLKNSKILTSSFERIMHKGKKDIEKDFGFSVTSPEEQLFYAQISFFLKTFFFVYIGILFSYDNLWTLAIGLVLAFAVMLSRNLSGIVIKNFKESERKLVFAVFARGLAAAAIIQVIASQKIPNAEMITSIAYAFIIFTIILSSIRIFTLRRETATTSA